MSQMPTTTVGASLGDNFRSTVNWAFNRVVSAELADRYDFDDEPLGGPLTPESEYRKGESPNDERDNASVRDSMTAFTESPVALAVLGVSAAVLVVALARR